MQKRKRRDLFREGCKIGEGPISTLSAQLRGALVEHYYLLRYCNSIVDNCFRSHRIGRSDSDRIGRCDRIDSSDSDRSDGITYAYRRRSQRTSGAFQIQTKNHWLRETDTENPPLMCLPLPDSFQCRYSG